MAEGGSSEPPKFSLTASTDPLRHKLWQSRQAGNFSDFKIEVNTTCISCHKLILAAQSEYFSRMLEHDNTAEVKQGSVDLEELEVDAVKLVVDFMYSGKIEFEFHVAQEVMKVIDRFQLTDNILKEKISEYIISHLCPDNCLGWFKFSEQVRFEKIKTKAESVMMQRFSDVCNSSEFASLGFEDIKDYIQKAIHNHYNQDPCLKGFVIWAMSDAGDRTNTFEEILTIIDLKKCSFSLLRDIYEKHRNALLQNPDLIHRFTTAALSRGTAESREATLDIIVTGGSVGSEIFSPQTWLLNLKSGSCAEKASHINTMSNCYNAMCAVPEGLICVGESPTGRRDSTSTCCVLYHKNTNTWVELPSPQYSVSYAGATCVQDALVVVVGGCDQGKKRAICLDLRTRKWTVCNNMLQGLLCPIVASVDDCVFVIFSTNTENQTVRNGSEISLQCYNTNTGKWSFKSPLPDSIKQTWGRVAVTIAEKLYLIGGTGQGHANYDPKCDAWTVLKPALHPHIYGAALVVNGKIIVSGGKKSEEVQDIIQEYDPTSDSWRTLPVKLPVPLYCHCMILA